jgi:hypothetical protein
VQEPSKLQVLVSNVTNKELVPSVIIQDVSVHVMEVSINQQVQNVPIPVVIVQEQDVRVIAEDLIFSQDVLSTLHLMQKEEPLVKKVLNIIG